MPKGLRVIPWWQQVRPTAPNRQPHIVFFPAAQSEIGDNWLVTGRKCSGSYDFPLSDFFLLDFDAQRNGPIYAHRNRSMECAGAREFVG